MYLVPILVCSAATDRGASLDLYDDRVSDVILCNTTNLRSTIDVVLTELSGKTATIAVGQWVNSRCYPTPTIIEAAQALYAKHDVKDISRSDSGAYNLSVTTETIRKIIANTKVNGEKAIIFVTGVPGAGKTLAGINIANRMHDFTRMNMLSFCLGTSL